MNLPADTVENDKLLKFLETQTPEKIWFLTIMASIKAHSKSKPWVSTNQIGTNIRRYV